MISIITICRNNSIELNNTILSYYQFLSDKIEAIVIDGSDNNACHKICLKYNVKYYKQESSGLYAAMNEGVKLSSGVTIIFMNSGDCFYNSFNLDKIIAKHSNKLASKIIFGDAVHTYKKFRKAYIYNKDKNIGIDWFPCHQSVFIPRNFLLSNLFDVNYKVSADTNLQRKAFSSYDYIYLNEVVCEFELGGISSRPLSIISILKHSNEVFLSRGITRKSYKFKFIAKQLLKLLMIKIIGYECYLKVLN
ncbi:glycosyltransferase [Photobacterium phosphoreum]|uniref:glycosyltransferase n=1 Tax=Photobacterium phosphoreum TaxID=659 RepID=UPI00242A8757|nr:glycosyltransferase [Photobacterium phosphoreum]